MIYIWTLKVHIMFIYRVLYLLSKNTHFYLLQGITQFNFFWVAEVLLSSHMYFLFTIATVLSNPLGTSCFCFLHFSKICSSFIWLYVSILFSNLPSNSSHSSESNLSRIAVRMRWSSHLKYSRSCLKISQIWLQASIFSCSAVNIGFSELLLIGRN